MHKFFFWHTFEAALELRYTSEKFIAAYPEFLAVETLLVTKVAKNSTRSHITDITFE